MPMSAGEHFGTEADGSPSKDYCTYCYQNGAFTAPDITIDEMAKIGGGMMSQMYAIPAEKAEAFVKEQLSCLKRWTGREVAACGSCGMPLLRDEDAGPEAPQATSVSKTAGTRTNAKSFFIFILLFNVNPHRLQIDRIN
jgi:hypothetical protein